jgi:hypothetical protein
LLQFSQEALSGSRSYPQGPLTLAVFSLKGQQQQQQQQQRVPELVPKFKPKVLVRMA